MFFPMVEAPFMRCMLFCVLLSGAIFAQTSIPAIVVDRDGQAVHGLQKSDFSVHSDKTTNFDVAEEVSPIALNGFGDPTPIFILYDPVSVPSPTEGQVSNMLLEYLRRASVEHLPVTILANQGGEVVKLIHDLSIPPSVLRAAISRVTSKEAAPN